MASTNHKCCDRQNVRKGLWSPEEDEKLVSFINKYGHGCWSTLPKYAGLERCGKSCRLRWINYLRPDLKRGTFNPQEAALVIECHKLVGNRWSHISHFLPGRTDNEIKNFWNSGLKKKIVAHQKHVQSLKKAAAAAQNHNIYYVNPNPQIIINHHMNPIISLQAPVTFTQNMYVPAAPVEVHEAAPVPFSDNYINDPEIFTQDHNDNLVLNYEYDDDFVSQFDDPFLNDGNPIFNQDSSSVVISFLVGQPENHACGNPEHHDIGFGVPLISSSAAQGQALDQPPLSTAENQSILHVYGRSCQVAAEVPAHHINFIESRMASFVASTPSSTNYLMPAPSPNIDALPMDHTTPSSSSWDFSADFQ